MSEEMKYDAVIVQRGDYFFGMNSAPAHFESNPEGSSVVVSCFDSEKNEPVGQAALLSWWDSHGIGDCVHEKLKLGRRNFPTPAELFKWTRVYQNGFDFCDICEGICAGYDCRVCPINDIKAEMEE